MEELTIIIPHYNRPLQLEALLQSIPQTELIKTIVVDDLSNESLDAFNDLKKRFDHVVFLDNAGPHHGGGAARNIGLKHLNSKWVMFADSDDIFLEGWFKNVLPYIKNTNYDLVYFKPKSHSLNSKLASRHKEYAFMLDKFNQSLISNLNIKFKILPPWSKLIKSEIIHKNKIKFETRSYGNDVMFSTLISFYSKNISVDEKSIYSVFETTVKPSRKTSIESRKERFYASLNQYEFLKKNLSKSDFKLLGIKGRNRIKKALKKPFSMSLLLIIIYNLIKRKIKL